MKMKHLCSVCEKVFKTKDVVTKISNAMVCNPNSVYIGLEESFDNEDIVHTECLKGYIGCADVIVEAEHPEVASPITTLVQTQSDDKVENTITGLKNLGVSHSRATEGITKMLAENPDLSTQDMMSQFNYGG